MNIMLHKEAIHQACLEEAGRRIETARLAMEEAQAAANDETKSSAGDKHETGRSMMQLERHRHAIALHNALENKKKLEQIRPFISSFFIQTGSLAETSAGLFYLSLGLGKIIVGTVTVYAVAPASPIGQLLSGKKAGDRFIHQELLYIIHRVL